MVLDAKDWLCPVAQALDAAIVKIKVGHFYIFRQAAAGYGKAVIMAGN